MINVIEVNNLVKKYEDFAAVDGVTFDVRKGEIFGLLGENGAGKTTTLEIIEGLRRLTSGTVKVLGEDVSLGCSDRIRENIGVQLQSSAYYNFLTLKEILNLFGGFYKNSISSDELLNMVDLKFKEKSLVKDLSGGQRQRFSIIASLVNDPEIVFLDEPTTGLDPIARRSLWDLIVKIKSQGKTVIITTHYMEEAEVLCDRIAIMDKGKILRIGETHKLIEGTKKPYKISFVVDKDNKGEFVLKLEKYGQIQNLAGKSNHFEMHLKSQSDVNKSVEIIHKLNPESLTVGRASLEDLFVELTGKRVEE
ncbi:MAG: ABC transporter ATP-binding protein [Candidatus Berkelbacteria bacterium]|nr:ABC transporter ATP-binding protein [Candidatus Berkelbacteria bacterium]